jgi:hypothetical protein
MRALDCTLGDGVFRSRYDADLRDACDVISDLAMPYAVARVDELFVENARAHVA